MTLEDEIRQVLNAHSVENGSNTPDFILAEYLLRCLTAFDIAVAARTKWYGMEQRQSVTLESLKLDSTPESNK